MGVGGIGEVGPGFGRGTVGGSGEGLGTGCGKGLGGFGMSLVNIDPLELHKSNQVRTLFAYTSHEALGHFYST